LGASKIASGSGLIKALTAQPSSLYMLDEFGQFLQGVTDRKKSPKHVIEIGDLFLELYTSSDGIYRGTDFAGGGPTERKREAIVNPALCLYGTTTSGHLWQALSESSKDDGSLARYLIFATSRDYPPENLTGGNFECPPGLVDQLALIAHGGVIGGNLIDIELASVAPRYKPVRLSPAARSVFADLSAEITEELNSPSAVGNESILARIKENAGKLALIRSVSREAITPYIEIHDVQWGILIARHSAELLIKESNERISENVVEANHKRVFRVIRAAGSGGIQLSHLIAKTRWLDRRSLHDVIGTLNESEFIEVEKIASGGKPATWLRSIKSDT
jgi:hypothetical protein